MPRDGITEVHEFTHFHFCCGLGGGKAGLNSSRPSVRNMSARLRCIGGVDNDPAAIRDFDRAGPGRPGTVMDLFTRSQYIAYNGKEPPIGWSEATPEDIRRAAGFERPNIVFISSPCKGASGLLSESLSKTGKYQALNELTLRCVFLMCEAWADDPVDLIVFENVPRLASRARDLLDQIIQLLQRYGYAVCESGHDCGELGNLAQSRKRMLLVARHIEKVPPFLYEPEKKRLRGVGEILGRMPFPGDEAGGPMHRVPRLQWKTWCRLAMVEAGGDWRSLNRLAVEDGYLKDFLIVPEMRNGMLGVHEWNAPTGTVTGNSRAMCGAFSVADPRHFGPAKHSNEMRIGKWDTHANVVSGAHGTGQCVADPRSTKAPMFDRYAVVQREGQKGYMLPDPRAIHREKGDAYLTGGHYGVVGWNEHTGAVSASAGYDNGRWSVADPRFDLAPVLPAANEKTVAMIRAQDGTWHRPFTTLELAAIQSLIDPDEHWSTDPQTQMEIDEHKRRNGITLCFDGTNDSAHRERIGNAVPPKAAQAIGDVMGTTLLLARAGETFILSAMPIWVQPLAIAISVAQGGSQVTT